MKLDRRTMMLLAFLVRVGFFFYGLYQDATMEVKYTDIDYYVFTDAARYVSDGHSPYLRETYRYTPLLAQLLVPSIWWFFSFGKILFVACDLITGWILCDLATNDLAVAACWLFNPVVITISTRGSSESLLTVVVLAALWMHKGHRPIGAGLLIGLAMHLKVYPFIYVPTVLLSQRLAANIKFCIAAGVSFASLSFAMYYLYGWEFLEHSYLYHVGRVDHRHNFSLYNQLMYHISSGKSQSTWERLASFVPQLGFSTIVLPLWGWFNSIDIGTTLFLQTFTFVAFNKVITSQYFIWYICLLPLLRTTLSNTESLMLCGLWVVSQAVWLMFGYKLEFKGEPVFRELFVSSAVFFIVQVFIISKLIQKATGHLKKD